MKRSLIVFLLVTSLAALARGDREVIPADRRRTCLAWVRERVRLMTVVCPVTMAPSANRMECRKPISL